MKYDMNKELKMKEKIRNYILIDVCCDYLKTIGEGFIESIKEKNMDVYATNNFLAISTYFNMNFSKIKNNTKIQKSFEKNIDLLLFLIYKDNSTIKIMEFYKSLQKFKSEFTINGYIDLSKELLKNFDDPQLLSPIFVLFDNIYENTNMVLLGFNKNNKKVEVNFNYLLKNNNADIRDCFMLTMDNAQNNKNILKRYIKLIKIDKIGLLNPNIKKIIPLMKHISRLYVSNKFNIFDNRLPTNYFNNMIDYAIYIESLNTLIHSYVIEFWNFLLEMKKDIFKERKIVLKKIDLNIKLNFFNEKIKDISFYEEYGENNVIILNYNIKNYNRQIPIVIENFYSIIFGYNICDLHVILLLMKIYNIDILSLAKSQKHSLLFNNYLNYLSTLDIDIEKEISKNLNKNKNYHKSTKMIYVNAFIRKLPKGQKHSKNAIDFAKRYSINLDENHTIVKPFIKNKQ